MGEQSAPAGRPPVIELRWSRTRGYIAVREPGTGTWHEIPFRDAPPCWRDELMQRRGKWVER